MLRLSSEDLLHPIARAAKANNKKNDKVSMRISFEIRVIAMQAQIAGSATPS